MVESALVGRGNGKGVISHCVKEAAGYDAAMARRPRFSPGGIAYHVMNRTWGKMELFEDAGDYEAFERVLARPGSVSPQWPSAAIA